MTKPFVVRRSPFVVRVHGSRFEARHSRSDAAPRTTNVERRTMNDGPRTLNQNVEQRTTNVERRHVWAPDRLRGSRPERQADAGRAAARWIETGRPQGAARVVSRLRDVDR